MVGGWLGSCCCQGFGSSFNLRSHCALTRGQGGLNPFLTSFLTGTCAKPVRNLRGTCADLYGTLTVARAVWNLRGTCAEPARNLHGTCAEPARNLRGTCAQPVRNLRGTCAEPARNLCGTCAEPVRNPRGTCAEPARNPRGLARNTNGGTCRFCTSSRTSLRTSSRTI